MRTFLIASGDSMKTGAIATLNALDNGKLAFASHGDGPVTGYSSTTLPAGVKRFQIMLGEDDVTGQRRHKVIPFYAHDLSYSVMTYRAATTFSAKVMVVAPSYAGTYTIIIAKKGVPFNERNKWTADVYVRDTNMTAADLATKLAASVNNNGEGSGVTASVTGADITIIAKEAAADYEILLADNLLENGSSVTVLNEAVTALADTAMVIDLANKAIADQGINDTYQEASEYMHPRYPITKGAASLAEQYDILTMRFAEPREMKTRDEVVHQIVQIAFPRTSGESGTTANAQLAAMTAILDKLDATKLV